MVRGSALRTAMRAAIGACALIPAVALAGAADTLIVNAHMPTAPCAPGCDTLAIAGGHILAIGSAGELARLRGATTTVIDAHGHTVIPGFIDNHVHLTMGGMLIGKPDLRTQKDPAAILALVKHYADTHPDDARIELGGWLATQFDAAGPTRQMIDAVIPDRPVVLWSLDRHSGWLNSRALALAHIGRTTPNPLAGEYVRDPATGEPTGWIKEFGAVDAVTQAMPKRSEAQARAILTAAMNEAHAYGITSVNEALGSADEFELLARMEHDGQLSLRVTYALAVLPGFDDARFERYRQLWADHPATPLLKTGVVKFFADGVPQSDTAFLLHPYGPQHVLGTPVWNKAEFERWVRRFDADGWQVMVHAMGDAAVRMALDGIEAAEQANPAPARGRRDRVEHAYLVDPADLPRFAKLGVIAAYQPTDVFLPPDTPLAPANAARPPQDNGRWNAVTAAGGRYSLGSDWPVFTMNALARIYAIADSRRADQRVPVVSLLKAYTQGGAYTTFADTTTGSLTPGKYADIAILSRDLIANPPQTAQDLTVDTTMLAGRVVYRKAGS